MGTVNQLKSEILPFLIPSSLALQDMILSTFGFKWEMVKLLRLASSCVLTADLKEEAESKAVFISLLVLFVWRWAVRSCAPPVPGPALCPVKAARGAQPGPCRLQATELPELLIKLSLCLVGKTRNPWPQSGGGRQPHANRSSGPGAWY